MYAPSGAVITQFPFPFSVPGGVGVGVGREKLALDFFFFNGMVVGWGMVLLVLLVVLVDCLLFVWCSSAMNGLYRVLGGDGVRG